MSLVLAAIALHVAMGAAWTFATLFVAATGRARPRWLAAVLGLALVNMATGIYLWHTLHAGPWGDRERWLVVGTFCAFVALGVQTAVAFTLPRDTRRLEGPALAIYRVTAAVLVVAATTMVASRVG